MPAPMLVDQAVASHLEKGTFASSTHGRQVEPSPGETSLSATRQKCSCLLGGQTVHNKGGQEWADRSIFTCNAHWRQKWAHRQVGLTETCRVSFHKQILVLEARRQDASISQSDL